MASCPEAVLRYLAVQNRPYSANDITQNLHKEFGKAAIQKALDQLAEQGRILEKTYGKQKVYCALQKEGGAKGDLDKELQELDSSITQTSDNLRAVEEQVRESEAALRALESSPVTEDAEREAAALEALLERLRARLADLTENCLKVSPQERKTIAKKHEAAVKEYRKRKRMCGDILDQILESSDKNKKALMDEIGVETDEDVGFKPETLC